MNDTQIKVLGAFDAAMQTFVEVWMNPNTTRTQVCIAYGGASALLLLVKQTTDINEKATQAAVLLNDAAEQLSMPQIN